MALFVIACLQRSRPTASASNAIDVSIDGANPGCRGHCTGADGRVLKKAGGYEISLI
jgi:hypothetical protein